MADRLPSRRNQRHEFEPLTMTWPEVAGSVLRVSESWLRDHIGELEGFPKPDRQLGVFATEAVRAWVRRRFGLTGAGTTIQDAEAILMERAKHADDRRPVSRRAAA